jgi:hypothetical protein
LKVLAGIFSRSFGSNMAVFSLDGAAKIGQAEIA